MCVASKKKNIDSIIGEIIYVIVISIFVEVDSRKGIRHVFVRIYTFVIDKDESDDFHETISTG